MRQVVRPHKDWITLTLIHVGEHKWWALGGAGSRQGNGAGEESTAGGGNRIEELRGILRMGVRGTGGQLRVIRVRIGREARRGRVEGVRSRGPWGILKQRPCCCWGG